MALKPNDLSKMYPAAATSNALMNAVVLDASFDVFLAEMKRRGLFEACGIVFKGGTALRKFRLGHKSRFSFDLDFAIEEGGEEILVDEMSGHEADGFAFTFSERRGHHLLHIESSLFNGLSDEAKIDFSNRACWLPPDDLKPMPSPALPPGIWDAGATVPNMRLEENVAEKLARWQSRKLVRDLYDLGATSSQITDVALVARIYVLKSHRNWSSSLPSRRPERAAQMLGPSTSNALLSEFVLSDLILPATVSDAAKRSQLRNSMERVAAIAESVDQHILGTDLEGIAADTGKLGWRVEQEIELLKVEYGSTPTDPRLEDESRMEAVAAAAEQSHRKVFGVPTDQRSDSRGVCGKRMPVAQVNCVLHAGHAPPCRSRL